MKKAKQRQWRSIEQAVRSLLHTSLKTTHGRIMGCGAVAGLVYVPGWLANLIYETLHGIASGLLASLVVLGGHQLWKQRQQLAQLEVSEADRFLGHVLVVSGILLCPLGFSLGEWFQRLVWLLLLTGMACSCWGVSFFRLYPLPAFLIFAGLFPKPTYVGKELLETLMPPQILERSMAWLGGTGLQLIGQPAKITGTLINLPGGSVDVAENCSGFDMACIMAVSGLALGVFLKQNWSKIILIVSVGVGLAFLFNVPRIMFMAFIVSYWGEAAFEFWHGFWGGQLFSTILYTTFYYAVMGITRKKPKKLSA